MAAAQNVILQAEIAIGIYPREDGGLGAQESLIQHMSTSNMSLPGAERRPGRGEVALGVHASRLKRSRVLLVTVGRRSPGSL